jgi:hypothetical protein
LVLSLANSIANIAELLGSTVINIG